MYRGLLRNEHVRIFRRTIVADGAGGSTSRFVEVIRDRYFCRIWRRPIERDRRDQGNAEDTIWGILGDTIDFTETDASLVGSKVVDGHGREFIVTRWWNERDGRVPAHAEGNLRLVSP